MSKKIALPPDDYQPDFWRIEVALGPQVVETFTCECYEDMVGVVNELPSLYNFHVFRAHIWLL